MVEYCVYWLENGEPMHEVFSSLAAAEMYSCAIRGKENIEWVEVSNEHISWKQTHTRKRQLPTLSRDSTAPGKEKIQRQG